LFVIVAYVLLRWAGIQ